MRSRRGRAAGKDIVVETCPQYLTLTGDCHSTRWAHRPRWRLRCARKPTSTALWKGIQDADGSASFGSDHIAPYTKAQKNDPPFTESPFGAPGIETLHDRFSTARASPGGGFRRSNSCSSRARTRRAPCELLPAERRASSSASRLHDLVVIDPEGRSTVTAAGQHTNSDYSLIEGWELTGRLSTVSCAESRYLRDGELVQEPGYGQFVPRAAAGRYGDRSPLAISALGAVLIT